MPNNNRAGGAQLALGPNATYRFWREDTTPRAATPQLSTAPYQPPHFTPTCGHHEPYARHVESLDGPARYLCRRCLLSAIAAEARAVAHAKVRAQWDVLFVGCRPRVTPGPGGDARRIPTTVSLPFKSARTRAERRSLA